MKVMDEAKTLFGIPNKCDNALIARNIIGAQQLHCDVAIQLTEVKRSERCDIIWQREPFINHVVLDKVHLQGLSVRGSSLRHKAVFLLLIRIMQSRLGSFAQF